MPDEPAPITLAAEVVDGAEQTVTRAKQGLDTVIGHVKDDPAMKLQVAEDIVHGAADTLETGLHTLGQAVFRFPSNVIANVNSGFQKIHEGVQSVVNGVLQGANDGFGALSGGINEVAGGINKNLSSVGQGVGNIPAPPPPPTPPSPPTMPSPPKVGS